MSELRCAVDDTIMVSVPTFFLPLAEDATYE
jgi:hypothetical protein